MDLTKVMKMWGECGGGCTSLLFETPEVTACIQGILPTPASHILYECGAVNMLDTQANAET